MQKFQHMRMMAWGKGKKEGRRRGHKTFRVKDEPLKAIKIYINLQILHGIIPAKCRR